MNDEQSGLPGDALHKELVEALASRGDEIAARLLAQIRKTQGESATVTPAACAAWISNALRQLGSGALTNGLGHAPATTIASTRDLWEVMAAHTALRRVLIDEAAVSVGRPLNANEIIALSAAISQSAAEAILKQADQINRKTRAQAETYSLHLQLLSHQLHGGLNGLLMMLEVLKGDLNDRTDISTAIADLNVLRGTIIETTETLDSLMEDIAIQADKFEPVELSEFATDAAEYIQSVPASRRWRIKCEASPGGVIATNRALLNVVLQQLVTFILRRGKGGNLRIDATALETGGGKIEITYDKPFPQEPELAQLITPPDPRLLTPVSQLTIARHAADLLKARLHAIYDPSGISKVAIEIPPPVRAAAS